jgi:hypothetical protein
MPASEKRVRISGVGSWMDSKQPEKKYRAFCPVLTMAVFFPAFCRLMPAASYYNGIVPHMPSTCL